MKNFRYLPNPDKYSSIIFALVEVPCGFLWTKTKTVKLFKPDKHDLFWRYVESGEYCRGRSAENLEKAYLAKKALDFKPEKCN